MNPADALKVQAGAATAPPAAAATGGKAEKTIGVRELFAEQVAINFVVVAVLIVVGAFLMFKLAGEAYTQYTVIGFLAATYFSFVAFLPAGTLFACRAEVAKGRVAVREKEKTGARAPLANPVTDTLPAGVAGAAILTVIASGVVYGADWTPSPLVTVLLALLFVVPYAAIVRFYVFRDIEGLLATGPMRGERVASKTAHIWLNYVLPTLVFQLIINLPLANRSFTNAAAAIAAQVGPGQVPVAQLAIDFAITFMFVCNFTFLGVIAHTAADMYQGRFSYAGKARGINGFFYFGLMLLMGLALGIVVAAIPPLTGVALVSFPAAMALKALVVLLSVYAGCRFAIGWMGKKFNDAVAQKMATAKARPVAA
jgi:hypothetical protein